jgi:hypothetical protein
MERKQKNEREEDIELFLHPQAPGVQVWVNGSSIGSYSSSAPTKYPAISLGLLSFRIGQEQGIVDVGTANQGSESAVYTFLYGSWATQAYATTDTTATTKRKLGSSRFILRA